MSYSTDTTTGFQVWTGDTTPAGRLKNINGTLANHETRIDEMEQRVAGEDNRILRGNGTSFTLSSGAGNWVELECDGVRWITLGFNGILT